MRPAERAFNLLFGLSALSWAVLGLIHSSPEARFTAPRLAISALNATVGALFLLRGPVLRHGSPGTLLAALPSLVLGGVVLSRAPSPETWPAATQAVFAAGLAGAAICFIYLGSSFALLPAARPVVSGGPYRWVRHPAYLGETAALVACALAAGEIHRAWPAAVALPLVVMRIVAEERVLRALPGYAAYSRNVRWRLLPGLW